MCGRGAVVCVRGMVKYQLRVELRGSIQGVGSSKLNSLIGFYP
jgi:hypothetical protein